MREDCNLSPKEIVEMLERRRSKDETLTFCFAVPSSLLSFAVKSDLFASVTSMDGPNPNPNPNPNLRSNPNPYTLSSIPLLFFRVAVSESDFAKSTRESLSASLSNFNRESLGHSAALICFGVGCVGNSHVAQHQAGLFLLIREWLQAEGFKIEQMQIYDPILCRQEKEALESLGCQILETNHDGAFPLDPSLFNLLYMPHCEAELYNNILAANWSTHLGNLCILGNSLRSYEERLPSPRWTGHMSAVANALPWMLDSDLRNTYKPNDVFNDTAFHVWPAAPQAPDDSAWASIPSVAPLPLPDAGAGGPKPKFAPAMP